MLKKPSADDIEISIITKKEKNLNFEEFYKEYNREAKDAVYTETDDSFIIEPEVIGVELDKEETKKILLENENNTKVYEIPAKITQPKVTAKMLEDKYVNKIIATYSTSFAGSSANRIANIEW
jgi:vancomycin resistance protein YoaR